MSLVSHADHCVRNGRRVALRSTPAVLPLAAEWMKASVTNQTKSLLAMIHTAWLSSVTTDLADPVAREPFEDNAASSDKYAFVPGR